MIGTGTADGTGAFTVTIPAGEAGANETLTAVAKTPAVQKVRQQRSKRQRILIRPWRPIVETVTGSTTKAMRSKGLLKLAPPLRFAMQLARSLVLQQLELTENIQ